MRTPPLVLAAALAAFLLPPLAKADDVTLTTLSDRVRVEIGGQLFTEYVFADGASRPYCYPILAPDGTSLTRDFPMKQTPGEETDHPWHRSMWFEHSMVNNVDFWNEGTGDNGAAPNAKGRTVIDGPIQTSSGPVGTITAHDRWIDPAGKLICTDERILRFQAAPAGRFLDYEVILHALPDAPLLIGDNKDGTMATRLAEWMTMPHKVKGVAAGGTGHIVDANGDRDEAVWGKRADWADYFAVHDGKTYGVAIFDAPQNLRHPTWWMARDYGLFGANPFGQHDYEKLPDKHAGDFTIAAGGSQTFRYRFYFHLGDPTAANVAQLYTEFAQAPAP